jgi:hypothetical protein
MEDMDYEPSHLPDIDAIELVVLRGLYPNHVSDYMKIAKNASCVHLQGDIVQQIAHLWRQLPPDEQMRCHNPPFGLRFYRENELLLEGSVCWECNNIFVRENGEDLAYRFDGQHAHSQQLLALLTQIKDQSL